MSKEVTAESLAKALATLKAAHASSATPIAAEQARQRVNEWLERHHTPSRADLERIRAALLAATTEAATYRALVMAGANLVVTMREMLEAQPASDLDSNSLIGLAYKYGAQVTRTITELEKQREAVRETLAHGLRFRSKLRSKKPRADVN